MISNMNSYWLASLGSKREDAGSEPGSAKVMDRDGICKYLQP